MSRRCGPNRSCGIKGGLLNPFFQNGNDLSGYGLSGTQGENEHVEAWAAQAVANGGPVLDTAITQSISDFINALELAGLGPSGSRMLTMNILFVGNKEYAKLNIKDVSTFKYTESGTVTFSAGNGCKSASSSYFNQPFKSNQFAGIESNLTFINYVSESETTDANIGVSGVRTGTPGFEYMLIQPKAAGRVNTWLHGTQNNQAASANHKGLFIVTNTPTTNVLYRDGVKTTITKTPVAPTVQRNRLVLAYNDGTTADGVTATGHYTRFVALDALYDSFSDTDAANFKTAFDNLKTASGLT